jgi:hypothetical protein
MMIRCILKSMCCDCSSDLLAARTETLQYCCSVCNNIFCGDCLQNGKCFTCSHPVCAEHCIKCTICHKRTCMTKQCINEFHICTLCQHTYCKDHFEDHKKYNSTEPYKLKCTSEKCRINQGMGTKGTKELIRNLIHINTIKELRLRTCIT